MPPLPERDRSPNPSPRSKEDVVRAMQEELRELSAHDDAQCQRAEAAEVGQRPAARRRRRRRRREHTRVCHKSVGRAAVELYPRFRPAASHPLTTSAESLHSKRARRATRGCSKQAGADFDGPIQLSSRLRTDDLQVRGRFKQRWVGRGACGGDPFSGACISRAHHAPCRLLPTWPAKRDCRSPSTLEAVAGG